MRLSRRAKAHGQLVAGPVALDVARRPDVLGQRRVEVDLVGRDADVVGQLLQGVLVHEQLVELPLPGESVLLGVADDRHDARQDLHLLGVATRRGHGRLELAVERLALLERPLRGEDRLGVRRRQRDARTRRAGLHDDRTALRAAADGERAADLEVLAAVVQHLDPVRVRVYAGLLVRRPRRRPPSRPRDRSRPRGTRWPGRTARRASARCRSRSSRRHRGPRS